MPDHMVFEMAAAEERGLGLRHRASRYQIPVDGDCDRFRLPHGGLGTKDRVTGQNRRRNGHATQGSLCAIRSTVALALSSVKVLVELLQQNPRRAGRGHVTGGFSELPY